jgi:5-methylcytosine-specific restriction endonuclease McrA
MAKVSNKTSINKIANHWAPLFDEGEIYEDVGNKLYTSALFLYLATKNKNIYNKHFEIDYRRFCWACGAFSSENLERAHIIARSHGGPDTAENYFLLCNYCHGNQPDGAGFDEQIDWLISAELNFNTFSTKYPKTYNQVKRLSEEKIKYDLDDTCEKMKEIIINTKSASNKLSTHMANVDVKTSQFLKSLSGEHKCTH